MHKLLRQFLVAAFAWAHCLFCMGAMADESAFREASRLYQQAEWQLAAEKFAECASDSSNSADRSAASFYRGECLMQLGKYSAAREQYGIVLEFQQNRRFSERALFRAGEAAWFSDDKDDARTLLVQYVGLKPQETSVAYALTYLGDISFAEADYQGAISSYRQAIDHEPKSTLVYAARLGLAKALLAIDEPQEVPLVLHALLEGEDRKVAATARLLLGRSQYDAEKFDSALATFRQLTKTTGGNDLADRACLAAGWSLWKLQRFADIHEQLKPLSNDPRWVVEYRYLSGMACYGDRQWAAAIDHLTVAANADEAYENEAYENHDAMIFYLGECCFRAGQGNEATKWWSQLIEQYPESQWADDAQQGLARKPLSNSSDEELATSPTEKLLDEAVGLERDGRYDPALAAYHELIESHTPGIAHEEALKRSARLHVKLAQYPMARKLYHEFFVSYPSSESKARVLAELAWLEDRGGNRAAAAIAFAELYAEFPQSAQALDAAYWLALEAADEEESGVAHKYVDWLIEELAKRTEEHPQKLWQQAVCLKCQLAASDSDWQKIQELLGNVGDRLKDDGIRTRAGFWLAEAEFRTGNYDQARKEFEKIELQVAGLTEPWVAMIPLRQAQLAARRQQWTEVVKLLEGFDQEHPNFELDYEVDYLHGRALAGRAEMTAAREAYGRVLDNQTAKNTETAAMAQWMIGETYFHQHDYARAKEVYLNVIEQHTQVEWQARAALQAGKCWELEGRWDEAKSLYSTALERWGGSESENQLQARLKWADSQVTKRL